VSREGRAQIDLGTEGPEGAEARQAPVAAEPVQVLRDGLRRRCPGFLWLSIASGLQVGAKLGLGFHG